VTAARTRTPSSSARRAGRRARGWPPARRASAPLRAVADRTAGPPGARLGGGRIYTDDIAPVEWLIDASIVKVAAGGGR